MGKIPLLDLKKQINPIRNEIDLAIKNVIDNANFILGSETKLFEEQVSQYCNVKYSIGVSNGTDAIKLALIALGVKSGDGVLCPTFTYFATAGAIASIGAIPVFVDINQDTYNISVESLEKVIKKSKKLKIKAVIPVHLYGQCADMGGIMKLAKKYKLKVIEDTAQAFGAEYKGRKAGAIADCGTVSFYPGKNLGAFGDAGMILTNNKSIANKLKVLRNQGNKEKYFHTVLGFNHRMDAIQAAVLNVKLKYLDCWNKKRQEIAAYYNNSFKALPLQTPFVAPFSTHIYHQYILRLNSSGAKLIKYLNDKGIDARVYYPLSLHLQKCFSYLGYKKGDFLVSERSSREIVAIPVHPDLTQEEKDYIVSSIKEFFNG
ncbi:MAG: DegT/DnrJ/EryC1/StrS family aminotransferase [Candidatus Omnitrophica bacterium]|nr:DegT/DnrJ/EryC1/StrS family aminotransferase [Candidatus Omnitrophota bacterium]